MPIFEYICDDCGTKFEKLVRRSNRRRVGLSQVRPGASDHRPFHLRSPFQWKGKGSEFPACPGGMCQTPDICGRD